MTKSPGKSSPEYNDLEKSKFMEEEIGPE